MIKCFKCDAPATQGPDGVIHMSCECFPPNLIRSGKGVYTAIPADSFTISAPDRQWITPDGLEYCPACGAPMLQPEHTCRKVKPVLTPEAIQDALKPKQRDDLTPAIAERMDIMREDARIEAEAEYKQAMQKCIEHLKTCSTCKYLSQVDGSVCPDMRKMRSMRDIRLIKEAEVQL